jgi:hypothetical protein
MPLAPGTRIGPFEVTGSLGAGDDEVLDIGSALPKRANAWSRDGRFIVYYQVDPSTGRDLWVLPLEGDRKPWTLLQTPSDEGWAEQRVADRSDR